MQTKIINNISLQIFDTPEEVSTASAEFMIQTLKDKPQANFLLPTGTTPLNMYEALTKESPSLFNQARYFNLDEYCFVENDKASMIEASDSRSYCYYMKTHFFDKLGITQFFFPDEKNATHEGTYDAIIKQNGGIDLCVNALGEDGHTFGFNFPNTSFDSRTRLVRMNNETQEVNNKLTGQEIPDYAITTGLATGMASKEVLFLITGRRKAQKLKECLLEPISETLPASILRRHPACHWFVDSEAASAL